MDQQTSPKPASTLIILNSFLDHTHQVYLIKRPSHAKFLANAHVFPGGRVDPSDYDLAMQLEQDAIRYKSKLFASSLSPLENAAYAIAALRETAEECGIIFAVSSDGQLIKPKQAHEVTKLIRNGEPYANTLAKYQLKPDISQLYAFSWWITPEIEKYRYDTRFFIAQAPVGQVPNFNPAEASLADWFSPTRVLDYYFSGQLLMAPPTIVSLEILKVAPKPLSLSYFQRYTSNPVCPTASQIGSHFELMLSTNGKCIFEHRDRFVWQDDRFV